MCTLIGNNILKAEKDYDCNSSEWLREYIEKSGTDELSISDMRTILKAKKDNYTIKKGDSYNYSLVINEENVVYPFRSILGIGEICFKHRMFP